MFAINERLWVDILWGDWLGWGNCVRDLENRGSKKKLVGSVWDRGTVIGNWWHQMDRVVRYSLECMTELQIWGVMGEWVDYRIRSRRRLLGVVWGMRVCQLSDLHIDMLGGCLGSSATYKGWRVEKVRCGRRFVAHVNMALKLLASFHGSSIIVFDGV